jgi:UDP:flavonoid glycosyltransferase YjiC (YdhE family)
VIFALAAGDARVLAYVPGGIEGCPDTPYSSVRLVDEPVDIARVAIECDFACTNGGLSTSSLLLESGVPHLVFPLFPEQRMNGWMVQSAQGGLVIDAEEANAAAGAIGWMLASGRDTIRQTLASRPKHAHSRCLTWHDALNRIDRLASG